VEFRRRRPGEGDLAGPWRVHPLDDELRRTGVDDDLDDADWASLEVPGHWGQLPRLDGHDGPILHRRRFVHRPPEGSERLWLRFDGVLSSAEVWLDGVYIGDTAGYFATRRFDVTELLARERPGAGDHLLAVEVACPRPRSDTNKASLTGSLQSGPLAPPGNPGGIWRPVAIDSTGPVAVRHARLLCLAADDDRAELLVRLVLDASEGTEIRIDTSVVGPDGSSAGGGVERHTLASGENRIEWSVEVERPRLWWPAALGQHPLYDVAVAVRTADGELSDRREWRTGLRRIEADDFVWRVNGERLFAKGIAYGPAGRFLHSIPDARFRDDVHAVVHAGLDLLRVSAHVAPEALYRAADEAGLLIWQDLPLLGGYSSRIRSTVRAMARSAVDALGHHPSVALWCGHSEPSGRPLTAPANARARSRRRRRLPGPLGAASLPDVGRWVTRQVLPGWNRSILDPVLGRELRNADRTRTVVSRSGTLPGPEDPTGSDAHLWLGWQVGRVADLPDLLRRWPRLGTFPGGIGSQSAALQDWSDAAPDWPTAERQAFARYLPRSAYADGRSWAAATRAYQADLLRAHIETLRRLKYRPTGGFCLVALADPEPAGGFGLLDVERRPKPAFDVVTDACRPVVVIADPPPALTVPGQPIALDVHAVSDLREPLGAVRITATARWEDDPDRDAPWTRRVVWEGDLAADDCARIGRFTFETPTGHGPIVVDLELVSDHKVVTNRYRTVVIPSSEALDRPGLRRS
jgi:beta-mannosidase